MECNTDYERIINMKPIFAVDVSLDKKNEVVNGKEFITRSISEETKRAYDRKAEGLDNTISKAKLPVWMTIVKFVCTIVAVAVFAGLVRAGDVEMALTNAPGLITAGVICAVVALAIHLYSKSKEKTVLKEENAEEQLNNINADIRVIYDELAVPQGARSVDVLMFRYIEKDGKIKVKTAPMQMSEYIALEVKAYVSDGCLNIADLENVYSFPLEKIKAIRTVRKRSSFSPWNKENAPTENMYKNHGLTVDQYGMIHMKYYYTIVIEQEGEEHLIYFPTHEIDVFEKLTGLWAQG